MSVRRVKTTSATIYTPDSSKAVSIAAAQKVTVESNTIYAPTGSTFTVDSKVTGYQTGVNTIGNISVVATDSSTINKTYSVSGDTKVLKATKKA